MRLLNIGTRLSWRASQTAPIMFAKDGLVEGVAQPSCPAVRLGLLFSWGGVVLVSSNYQQCSFLKIAIDLCHSRPWVESVYLFVGVFVGPSIRLPAGVLGRWRQQQEGKQKAQSQCVPLWPGGGGSTQNAMALGLVFEGWHWCYM